MGETLVLEGAKARPDVPKLGVNGAVAPYSDDRNYLTAVFEELDGYYATIQDYENQEPDEVMLSLSGILSRCTALRAQLLRSGSQRANKVRTGEVEPLTDALELQFKIHSRLVSMRELDFKVTGAMI